MWSVPPFVGVDFVGRKRERERSGKKKKKKEKSGRRKDKIGTHGIMPTKEHGWQAGEEGPAMQSYLTTHPERNS